MKRLEQREMLDRWAAIVREQAQQSLDAGAAPEPVPRPEGFGQKKQAAANESEKTDEVQANTEVQEEWSRNFQQELVVALAKETFKVEELREEDRDKYLKVREEDMGICASCRWSSGCFRCSEPKAWDYYVWQALGLEGSKAKPRKSVKKTL
jgi:hypothetical protein